MRAKRDGGSGGFFESLEARRLLAVDLLSDAAGLSGAQSVTVSGVSYFFANDGDTGRELWKSDGTGAGTVEVKDLTAGPASSELFAIYNINGRAVFLTVVHNPPADQQTNDDYTLWSSDGTPDGTVKLQEFKSVPWFHVKQLGEKLALLPHRKSSFDPMQREGLLWFSDGTPAGTTLVKSFLATPDPGDGSGATSFFASKLLAAGNRVVFDNNGIQLFSSDGTSAGTIELTSAFGAAAIEVRKVNLTGLTEIPGKVLIPGNGGGDLFVTDGTLAGTVSRPSHLQGEIEIFAGSSAVAGNKFYFSERVTLEDGNTPQLTLYALDLDTDALTQIYRVQGGSHLILMNSAGSKIAFRDSDADTLTLKLYITDGTSAGTTKLAELSGFPIVSLPVNIDGANFFVVATGPHQVDADPATTGVKGWIGVGEDPRPGLEIRDVNLPGGVTKLELWRSDGTPESTAVVGTLWQGDPNGKFITSTVSEAHGKLLVHTKVLNGVPLNNVYPNNVPLTTVSDETLAFDSHELNFGRNGATARLVNGILRIGGSLAADTISMWRSSKNPDKLVIAYNGNERGFLFSSITKIVVDLQSGNDKFEILEAEGGPIKLRTSVFAGDGTDTILTGAGRDTILGGEGGDLIRSRGNADIISGGGGKDRISSGAGDDQIAGGTGNDSVIAGAGIDVLFGQTAIEKAFGEDLEGQNLKDDVLLT